jgi:hypothetical protein
MPFEPGTRTQIQAGAHANRNGDILSGIPGYYTKARHRKLVEWMKHNKPKTIINKPVWVVPHSFIDPQLAIRPFPTIFVSDELPKWLRDTIVYHEFIETQKVEELGHKKAHEFAVEAEYRYLVEHKLLDKFLKSKYKGLVIQRERIWKKKGYKIPVRQEEVVGR